MLQLDFPPLTWNSRKKFLYNKALATTLDGSRKFLARSLAKSSCENFGVGDGIWWYIGKNIEGGGRAGKCSGLIPTGSYFGKMTPHGSGSFLNRIFGLPRPKNIKKSPHSYRQMPGSLSLSLSIYIYIYIYIYYTYTYTSRQDKLGPWSPHNNPDLTLGEFTHTLGLFLYS